MFIDDVLAKWTQTEMELISLFATKEILDSGRYWANREKSVLLESVIRKVRVIQYILSTEAY